MYSTKNVFLLQLDFEIEFSMNAKVTYQLPLSRVLDLIILIISVSVLVFCF